MVVAVAAVMVVVVVVGVVVVVAVVGRFATRAPPDSFDTAPSRKRPLIPGPPPVAADQLRPLAAPAAIGEPGFVSLSPMC